MDDLFKRGVFTYLGLTGALWLISLMMKANGSAFTRNPAWQMVVGLRNVFTFVLVIAVVGLVCIFIFESIEAERRQKVERAETERQKLIVDENHREWFLEQQERALEKQIADQKRKQWRQEKIKEEEQQRLEHRQSRTAEDAASSSLDSFLL